MSMTNPQGLEQAAGMIQVNLGDEGGRLLEPVDRISEILFGLIMAVTIVGSLSIATAICVVLCGSIPIVTVMESSS